MYAITANYEHTTPDGYTGSRQIPTFYLDEHVQGIVDEAHAVNIARDILTSCLGEMLVNDFLHVTAVNINRTMVKQCWGTNPDTGELYR